MGQVDAGHLSARALVAAGVSHLFGLGGGHIKPTWWAAPGAGLRIVDVRHEAAAVYAAQGWALATAEPGACIVTAGPGVTNALTGLATARADGVPVVCLAGAATDRGSEFGEVEHLDQLALVAPVTKSAERVRDLDRIPSAIARAFRIATEGRPGPTYVEIPIDVAHSTIDDGDVEHAALPTAARSPRALTPDPGPVDEVVELLRNARRPVLIAGSGVWWSRGGARALRDLVDATGIPVVTRQAGRGTVPDDHPASCGRDWQQVMFQADVAIVVGSRLNYFFGYGAFDHLDALVQVDIEPGELGRSLRPPDVAIVGDAAAVLGALTSALEPLDIGSWRALLARQRDAITHSKGRLAASGGSPIHPLRVCTEVVARVPDDAVIIPDGANNLMWCNVGIPARTPGSVVSMGPLGTIGHGVGLALGAACARPGRPVVWMVGDGSFGFHAMELDTAARHELPIVAVVMNNGGWSGQWIPLGVGHYERMAAMWDGIGELVEHADALGPALDRALASSRPAILNVRVDPGPEWFGGRAFGPPDDDPGANP
jgi:acetolactate synthase-1/2/3 large subunit